MYVHLCVCVCAHTQVRLDGSDASWSKYLIEGMDVELLQYKGKVIAIDASTSLYQFLVAVRTGQGESYQNLTNDK